ncbi:DUF6544 family protein [Pontibacter russatus]|uniref:DUF6544 family protein n=1 Tax=Pontibacter russatus TaxID=2694929 RepID=UPI00137B1FB4|nr:DUF6544 family protein [Pontibacter russatus]
MLRFLFAFLQLVHGLLHLLGLAKAFGYGQLTQLNLSIPKPVGLLWGLATLLFLVSAVLYLLKREWWYVGLVAVLLSQALISLVWQDARYGTLANCIIIIVGIVSYADWRFDRKVEKEVASLFAETAGNSLIVKPEMLLALPPVVHRWVLRSGVVGKEWMHTGRLKQKGAMRTKPNGRWMMFEAVQYVALDEPGFNWQTKVQLAPGFYLTGRDKYENGQGEMLIKLLSLKEVVHDGGTEQMNQGTLLRYLGEMCWFPAAVLQPYIIWESIDSFSARATMKYGGSKATGVFFYNEAGDITAFEAMRYGNFNGKMSLEKWRIETKAYRDFRGIRVPSKLEVTWKLKTGDFTWLKLELTDLQFNNTERYLLFTNIQEQHPHP